MCSFLSDDSRSYSHYTCRKRGVMTAVLVFPVSVMTTRPSSVLALLGPRHSKNTWNMNKAYIRNHGIYRKSPVNKFRKSKPSKD
jgi:hypothetical protein